MTKCPHQLNSPRCRADFAAFDPSLPLLAPKTPMAFGSRSGLILAKRRGALQ